jgi:hypothetical protein
MPFGRVLALLSSLSTVAPAIGGAAEPSIKETAHVVVTGGPHAGRYDATGTRGGCSAGLNGPGSWGSQLSALTDQDPTHLTGLLLIVPDGRAAASGSKEFLLTVAFGPLLKRSGEYKVDARKGVKPTLGSGVVTVKDDGATGQVTFRATTDDGIQLEGTIDCKTVTRARE